MSTPAGDDLVGNATIRVDGDTDPATRALAQFSRDAQGRLRNLRGQFVSESGLITRSLTTAAGGGDRFSLSLRSLANVASSVGGVLGRVGVGVAGIGAAAGTAAPLLAGIVTTLQNVAPAGAVAVTGMLAVQQASAVIRLGMMGVQESVTAAFDTSAAGAAKFEESLKGLAPAARDFALTVRELAPAFREFQQTIQQELFTELDSVLKTVATATLPVLRTNLATTANILGNMAAQTGLAAAALAKDGTLGQAMDGANQGLRNLEGVPAQVTTALGQLAAAGAPAFDRITAAAGRAATGISERLGAAFESGALERAVNTAVDLLRDLGTVAANVFGILGNVMAPVQAQGAGLVGVLVEITGALRDATGTAGFQDAIGALAGVMGTLARTAGPLLGQALAAIGPVFTALGPPVERLITNLGSALSPIITALGPVLAAAATAVGALVDAVSPLLPVIGNLAASLLPPLVPLLQAIGDAFTQAAPVVQLLGQALTSALAPILAQLPALVQPLATFLTSMASTTMPLLAQMIVQLTPTLAQLGASFGQLLAAAAPLLTVFAQLYAQHLASTIRFITPVISLALQLAAALAGHLTVAIRSLVIPTLQLLAAILRGDLSAAWNSAKAVARGFVTTLVSWFVALPGQIFSALGALAARMRQRATEGGVALVAVLTVKVAEAVTALRGFPARAAAALGSLAAQLRGRAVAAGASMLSALQGKINEAVAAVATMPGRAAAGLGNLSGRLQSAGRDLILGMVNGIRSMAGSLVSAAQDVVGDAVAGAKSLLGISSPSKVFAEIGRDTGRGFIKGLTGTREQIEQTSRNIAKAITNAFKGRDTRVDNRLVEMIGRNNQRLKDLATERDRITAQLQAAQQFRASATQSARSFASLSNLEQPQGQRVTGKTITAGLQERLRRLRNFAGNIRRLVDLGVRKDVLRQIIEMGPDEGSTYAAALVAAGKQGVKQINSVQSQIARVSSAIGTIGADALYDSGRNAGKGFLTGLKEQKKSIERLMLDIAKGMQRAIRQALGIRSPSRVLAQLGRLSILGLENGITRSVSGVDAAMARVAGAVTSGVPTTLPGVGAMRTSAAGASAAAAPAQITVNLNLTAGVIGSQFELQNWLTEALDDLGRTGRLPASVGGR